MKSVFRDLVFVIALGGFGGFIRTLAGRRRGEPYRWRVGVTEVLIAIFAGLVVHWVCCEYVQSDNIRTASVALAGYSARSIMTLFEAAFVDKMKSAAKAISGKNEGE